MQQEIKGKLESPDWLEKLNQIDLLYLLISCLLVGVLMQLPKIAGINMEHFFFYEKNAALIVFSGLALYTFLNKSYLNTKHLIWTVAIFAVTAVYINLLPSARDNQSVLIAYIHLPLLLWSLYGLIFINFNFKNQNGLKDYLRFNGDLAVLFALIALAGILLTGLTLGLFSTLGFDIEQLYFEHVVLWGAVAAPVVATFIIRHYPSITEKIVPVIATLFSPLILLTLLVFLVAVLFSGQNPYQDRAFLLLFNIMLVAVMAIIVFSVSGQSVIKKYRFQKITLFLLAVVAIVINVIVLSAIVYRLGEFGLTPNRVAVLGSNMLIFGHLGLTMLDLYRVNFKNGTFDKLELNIAAYLPVYGLWTICMVFVLPIFF